VQQAYNAERLEKIRAKRPQMQFITLSAAEREAFRQRSLPVRQQYLALAPERGAEVLEALEAAVRRAEAGSE
jgi:TRAP-type C4-dicarboxylate transport system substrate-binding protein